MDAAVEVLLRAYDEAYVKSAWHGPNVRATIRGLDAATATWRPAPERHNIRELVVHIAYWKYVVRKRLSGTVARGSFALEGSNWFRRDEIDDAAWQEEIAVADREHKLLREVISKLRTADLSRKVGRHDVARTIFGITAHDNYHNGQIALIRRMADER